MSSATTPAISGPGAARTKQGRLAALFAICFISSTFGGIVSTLMSVYLPVAVRDLLGPVTDNKLNTIGATINSLFLFGWMFGGIIWGLICDRIGRARAVMLSTLCYSLFTMLTAVAPSWWLVTACRFLSGFGVGGAIVTTTIIVSESWRDKGRAIALGILSISIPAGIFSAGLINYLLPQWRLAFLTGAIPLFAAGTALFVLKEPEKWNSRSRGKETGPGFLAGANRKSLLTGSVIFGAMLIGIWAIFSWLPTWVQDLSGLSDARHQRGLSMMLMGAGGLTGGFVSGWVAYAIGLRRTMALCFAVCFAVSFLLFKVNHSFSGAAYLEIAVLALFFGISQGALSVYIPELFPTAVGASATGVCFNVGRLFTATAVFFVGALVHALGGYSNALFIFSFIFLIGLLATWFAGKQ